MRVISEISVIYLKGATKRYTYYSQPFVLKPNFKSKSFRIKMIKFKTS